MCPPVMGDFGMYIWQERQRSTIAELDLALSALSTALQGTMLARDPDMLGAMFTRATIDGLQEALTWAVRHGGLGPIELARTRAVLEQFLDGKLQYIPALQALRQALAHWREDTRAALAIAWDQAKIRAMAYVAAYIERLCLNPLAFGMSTSEYAVCLFCTKQADAVRRLSGSFSWDLFYEKLEPWADSMLDTALRHMDALPRTAHEPLCDAQKAIMSSTEKRLAVQVQASAYAVAPLLVSDKTLAAASKILHTAHNCERGWQCSQCSAERICAALPSLTGKINLCPDCEHAVPSQDLFYPHFFRSNERALCLSCIGRKHMRICPECGRYYEGFWDTDTCPICAGVPRCSSCGRPVPEDDREEVDCELFCPECLEIDTMHCAECGRRILVRTAKRSEGDEHVCDCCAEHMVPCARCGVLCNPDNAILIDEQLFCHECAETAYEDALDNQVHVYHYRPAPVFFSDTTDRAARKLYFGIELEYDFDSAVRASRTLLAFDAATGQLKNDAPQWYYKHDGSLCNGWELVTHPRTLRSWQVFDLLLDNLPLIDSASDDAASYAGLHVHISKKGMTKAHMLRFDALFANNWERWIEIAGRECPDYADFGDEKHDGRDLAKLRDGRYHAVNWTPDTTVEVRIFAATTDRDILLGRIEACHAAYVYTKTSSIAVEREDGKSWHDFTRFVQENRKLYKHLMQILP